MNYEKILIVDDDKEIVNLIQFHLKNEGYDTLKACNGNEALRLVENNDIDLIILDIMMPELDGIEICRRVRMVKNIPIIILSAKSSEIDKVIGLSIGADDYVIKPFSTVELIARVKAQLRRYIYLNNSVKENSQENLINVNGLQINKETLTVKIYGKRVNLTKTEYAIVLLMAENPNRVFPLEEIFERVWKEKYFQGNNTVMVHIARIREKIEENPRDSKIIKTVWGVGYKIES
ncbi:TPA: response regulator transcription factor [Clostridium botulinum]|uniref:response regulator transcription factor n=1 Tax=Clostridium sporogenes TaxID=1509 RepID=UPI0013D3D05E|nr:response regulator transcription factor [Clostridium sporogenes]EJE7234747.1 response regulator transcription factor [Clostridium botulinum]NFE79908.1 response regulator transcription factor [Clostridium sporogenes]NFG66914.1 response regulator transcription factor [Clostridium sporogenes]HDK7157222.1 response regulator transcription factor [Clostridium botulinum]HDK7175886.1 response regulator transcription factor [Clostridium botulinum]